MASKTAYGEYIEKITTLAQQGMTDGLKKLMRERLWEKKGPSLLRDEYNETDVLFVTYSERKAREKNFYSRC